MIDVLADLGSRFLLVTPYSFTLLFLCLLFASSDRSLFWVVGAWCVVCVYDFHSRLTFYLSSGSVLIIIYFFYFYFICTLCTF